VIFLIKKQG